MVCSASRGGWAPGWVSPPACSAGTEVEALADEAAELAGRLLAALVASLEGSGGASGSEEQGEEGPGEEEVAGYSAAYARLHNAYK